MSLSRRVGRWIGGVALTAGVLAGMPAAAQAQTPLPEAGTWDITPFLGIGFGGDTDGSTLLLGAAGGYHFTPLLTFEGELAILPDLYGDTDLINQRVTTVSGNVLYHFDTGGIILPYATVGLGFARVHTENDPLDIDDSRTQLAVNLGGGIKADVAKNIQVRGDLRYVHVNDTPDYWRTYAGIVLKIGQR
jgi:opacity protein-like surface antigen